MLVFEPIGNTMQLIDVKIQFSGVDSTGRWKDRVAQILRGEVGLWGKDQLCQESRPCLRSCLWLRVVIWSCFLYPLLNAEEKQEGLLPLLLFHHLFAFLHSGKKPVVVGDMKNWASCFPFLCPHASFRCLPQDTHSVFGTAAALLLSFQAALVLGMKSVWFLTVLLML